MPILDANGQNILISNAWTVILRELTAREQTPLRRVSKGFRELVNEGDKGLNFTSGYGRLLLRFNRLFAIVTSKTKPIDPNSFKMGWDILVGRKLKPAEVDFFTAVICGDVLAAGRLLKETPGLIVIDYISRYAALLFAAALGDVQMLNGLYPYIPADAVSLGLCNPRHLLCMENVYNVSPLNLAIRSGQLEAIQWLKQKLQDFIAQHADDPFIVSPMRQQLNSLPYLLIAEQQDHLLDALVDEADINRGITCLLDIAASKGNIALLKRLMACPAYRNQLLRSNNEYNCNVLHSALKGGHIETIDLLIASDASLIDTVAISQKNALYYAIRSDKLVIVKKVVELRPALLQIPQGIDGEVNEAIKVGSLEILAFLLKNGASLDIRKHSALALAVEKYSQSRWENNKEKSKNYLAIIHYLINHIYQGVQQGKYTQTAVDEHYIDALRHIDERFNSHQGPRYPQEIILLLISAGAIPDFESRYSSGQYCLLPSMEKIQAIPELQKLRQEYQDKIKESRWQRALLWLSLVLLSCGIGMGAYALLSWVILPLALSILTLVAAAVLGGGLIALSIMAVLKITDDTWNMPFFSRVRLKPFAPVANPTLFADEAAAKAKMYYSTPATDEAKSKAALVEQKAIKVINPATAAPETPIRESISTLEQSLEGEREVSLLCLKG